jgi:hypothetical protein
VTARVEGTVRVCDNCGSKYHECQDQEAVRRGLVENYCPWCGYPQDLDGEMAS